MQNVRQGDDVTRLPYLVERSGGGAERRWGCSGEDMVRSSVIPGDTGK